MYVYENSNQAFNFYATSPSFSRSRSSLHHGLTSSVKWGRPIRSLPPPATTALIFFVVAPLLCSCTDPFQCQPPTNEPIIGRTRQSTRDHQLRKAPAVASKRQVTRERTDGFEPLFSSVKCVSTLTLFRTYLWPNQWVLFYLYYLSHILGSSAKYTSDR